MRALLRRLDDPQLTLRGALIAGTNGKGSTQAMVASVLSAGGYLVAQAPSPHLASYRERIVVDGRPIERHDLDVVLEDVLDAAGRGEARHGPATEFELLIAAAFLWFARRRVDVAVMEVGLGGRLDATNTWDGGVAAITNVGMDHRQLLGPTIEHIAREKAAIIKRGDRAVTGASGVAHAIIARRAARLGVPLTTAEPLPVLGMRPDGLTLAEPRLGRLRLGLTGRHQAANAAVALGVLDALSAAAIASVGDDAVRRGLATVRWPARLETLVIDDVTAVLDGAHNPDGAAALVAALRELRIHLPSGRPTMLLAILADKEVPEMVATLASDPWLATARLVATDVPDTERSLAAADLVAQWAASAAAGDPEAIVDVDAALERALALAREDQGPLLVAGSLYLAGHVRSRLTHEAPRPDDEPRGDERTPVR